MKTSCENCGDVSTTIDKVVLRVLDGSNDKIGHYRFICPNCNTIVVKNASEYVINILNSSGVKVEVYNLSMELLERPTELDASPISEDEVTSLHLELEEKEEEWMNKMLNKDQK